jgi:CBS domain-containing protein
MSNSATEMLVSACIQFLQAYPPFDRMEAEALRFLAEHVRLAHYPKGARILSSEMGVARTLYIIQHGKVYGRSPPSARQRHNVDSASNKLDPGQSFAIGGADGAATDFECLRGTRRGLLLRIAGRRFLYPDPEEYGFQPLLHASTSPVCSGSRSSSCNCSLPSAPPSRRR